MNHYFSKKRVQVVCITMWGNWRKRIAGKKYLLCDNYVMIFE